jgi:hypothetical protein
MRTMAIPDQKHIFAIWLMAQIAADRKTRTP